MVNKKRTVNDIVNSSAFSYVFYKVCTASVNSLSRGTVFFSVKKPTLVK